MLEFSLFNLNAHILCFLGIKKIDIKHGQYFQSRVDFDTQYLKEIR